MDPVTDIDLKRMRHTTNLRNLKKIMKNKGAKKLLDETSYDTFNKYVADKDAGDDAHLTLQKEFKHLQRKHRRQRYDRRKMLRDKDRTPGGTMSRKI